MKKQSSIEWLVEKLNESIGLTKFTKSCDEEYKIEILGLIEQAKEMEKEIIRTAYLDGMDGEYNTSEQYYNETFKSV